jgi:hypothetical protein
VVHHTQGTASPKYSLADMNTIRNVGTANRTCWGTLIDTGEGEILHGSDRSITNLLYKVLFCIFFIVPCGVG